MLVLSRRLNEKIVFPAINATVQVVAIKPGSVRLGIEAPSDVLVLREEVVERRGPEPPPRDAADAALQWLNHLFRNRLGTTSVGAAPPRQHLQGVSARDMERTLDEMERALQDLRGQVEGVLKHEARPRARRRKALLVEDNRNERELLAAYLRLSGLEVDTAGDGADALDYLRGTRPDVVLLDMRMPRCDGPTTVRAIRGDPAHAGLKIYAVTGCAPGEVPLASGPGGIDRWFQKPFDPQELVRQLRQEFDPAP